MLRRQLVAGDNGSGPLLLACLLLVVVAVVVAVVSGWWRVAMRPFTINADTMTVSTLGFRVTQEADIDRVHGICQSFAGGFNAMIASRSPTAWSEFSDAQPLTYRPFADEGAAMGYPLRKLGRFSAAGFERDVVKFRPSYAYLHYVGLGFWYAMRRREPQRLARLVEQLDPLHGMLCWDGYGFQQGFFDSGEESRYTWRFTRIHGYARNVAYQGLGRSLWFRYMDAPSELNALLRSFDEYAADAASGVGLASVFAVFDRPERGLAFIEEMPDEWHADIMLGMCFAYKARSLCDGQQFDRTIDKLDVKRREAIRAAVEACDAIESKVRRSCDRADGYRTWRRELSDWLNQHVAYPFVEMNEAASGQSLTPV